MELYFKDTKLLTNNHSIREVILFPPLRKDEEA